MMRRYSHMLLLHCVKHAQLAVFAFILDYLAYKIGKLWLVGAAALHVTNGGMVFPVSLLAEWLLGIQETSFVFSVSFFTVHNAYPLVFNAVDTPTAEMWYDFRQTGVPTLPVYILVSLLLHYPRRTMGAMAALPGQIWTQLVLSISAPWSVVKWALFIYALYFVLVVLNAALDFSRIKEQADASWIKAQARFKSAWRWGGKAAYDFFISGGSDQRRSNAPFVHTQLGSKDEIRLLRLLPRGNSDTIRCEMLIVELTKLPTPDVPTYDAMSYAWGRGEVCRIIYIDGRPFETTQVVYDLLYERSPVYFPRTIWIDSICIDQQNNEEKTQQLKRMTDIYRIAGRVTAWLGVPTGAHLANDLLVELNYVIKNYALSNQDMYRRYVRERRSPRWLALGDLFENPYFTRLWMVQEVAVNKKVHVVYGGQLLNWDTLADVFVHLMLYDVGLLVEDSPIVGQKKRNLATNGASAVLLDKVRVQVQRGKRLQLADILKWCWSQQSSDSRDKVFALSALATGVKSELITPNCKKPVDQVYIDAARYFALHENTLLGVLCCAGIGWQRKVAGLPSWVPDWSVPGRTILSSCPEDYVVIQYNASGGLTQTFLRLLDSNKLELDAIVLDDDDAIRLLGPVFKRPPPTSDKSTTSMDLGLMAERTPPWVLESRQIIINCFGDIYHPTGQPLEEAFWRTLVGDTGPFFERPAPAVYGTYYWDFLRGSREADIFWTFFGSGRNIEGLPADPGDRIRLSSQWVTAAQRCCLSRRVAATSSGFIGTVPPETKLGDRIAIIPSVSTPFIIRPIQEPTTSCTQLEFELIGECYIHGLMHYGERANPAAVERIVLC